jgi:DNA-dependent RNA polymerase auxiliary subunit epsilon
MDNEMVKVYVAGKLYEVELIKGLLNEEGIQSEILNQKDRAFLTGDIELYVNAEDAEKARQLIAGR